MGKKGLISKKEVYVSVDVETDGPIPGVNSMLSIGAAAYTADKKLLGTFSANLEQLQGANPNEKTMREFWDKNPEAWEACRKDCVHPAIVMQKFVAWVSALPGTPVFVAYPAGFDFTYVYWYMMNFCGYSPFSFSALDIKTLAMALLNGSYRNATKRNMPKRWFDDLPHTHVAVDDAIEQGALFCNMLAELRSSNG